MAFLSASKALSFFETFFSFFWGKLSWSLFDVYIHSIRVSRGGISGGVWRVEHNGSLGRVLFCNGSHKVFLAEELVDFLILSFGSGWDYFHSIDAIREPDWDSCTEIVDDGGSMSGGIEFGFNNF